MEFIPVSRNAKIGLKPPAAGIIALALAVIFVLGCSSSKPQARDPRFEKWRAKALESRAWSPAPRPKKIELPAAKALPAAAGGAAKRPQRPLPKRKVTLNMHQADVAVLLKALARAAGLDIIINSGVKGKMSLNVRQAPWCQVFKGILNAQGLSYTWEGNILRIESIEDKKRNLKQLEAEQQIQEKRRLIQMRSPLITRIIPIDYADAGQMKTCMEKLLTVGKDGKPVGSIMVDKHTNALIVQATAEDLARMVPLIERLDRPTAQILIEANIVETTRRTARELGVQWGGLYHSPGQNFWFAPGAESAVGISPGAGETVAPDAGFAFNFPADLTSAAVSGSGMTIGFIAEKVGESILAIQLTALEEQGKLNILSSPSITTLDNQTALIESGDEVPFQTVEDKEVKIEYKKAVLSLKVTPHVIDGDTLKLNIKTIKDELDFSRTVAGNPTLLTKKAETNVILFNGQTTVIGGLNKTTARKVKSGVPYLQNIPLIGNLFRGESNRDQMEEILIFITPYILKQRAAVN